jgi:prepilin-type N-terminal cleavage/methylation domain-containing protein
MINRKNKASNQERELALKRGILMSMRLLRSPESSQSGFTLLESLIAMVVVSLLMVGIAPMLALTVAARVQARRVDLATQEARTYMNGVRAGVITIPARPSGVTDTTQARILQTVAGLTNLPTNSATLIDTNGDGFRTDDPNDLVIQAIRNGINTSTTPPVTEIDVQKRGFDLVVRVYRADAFDSSGAAIGTLQINTPTTTATASAYKGNLGSRTAPLVVVSSDAISQSTQINDYRNRALGQ